MTITSRISLVVIGAVALVLASCGGGGDVVVGGGSGGGGPPAVTYRVLDLATGAVTTTTTINLADAQYTSTKMVFRQVLAGTLTKGSSALSLGHQSDETSATVVMPAQWVAILEMTQGQWSALTGDAANQPWRSVGPASVTASSFTGAAFPAFGLTEVELNAAVNAWNVGKPVAGQVAIPTNNQWEYACRGQTTTLFPWGDELATATAANFAVTRETASGATGPRSVISGRFSNGFGLWDMTGNVREWTKDGGNYDLRGGGWSDNLLRCRSANLITSVDVFRHALSGARLVMTAP